ncbi:MAG: sugar transferase [Candidatus Omnitrophota bacterium]|nr:sugar transferase [Candidatus Omnitrophota bacterium]
MLKERENLIRRAMIVLDAVVVALAFFVSYFLRAHLDIFYKFDLFPSVQVIARQIDLWHYLPVLFLSIPIWIFMLVLNGLYRPFRTLPLLAISWIIVKAGFFSILAFSTLVFILKIEFISRLFFIMFFSMSCGLLILEKWIFLSISHYARRKGYNFRRILIVGTGPRAKRFVEMIQAHPEWGMKINGLVDDDISKLGKEFFGIEVIGILKDIPRILLEEVTDEVIFIVPRNWLHRIQDSIAACEVQGIKTSVAADLFELKIARARQTELNGFPLISFETTFGYEWQLFIKRAFDLIVSGIILIVISPFLLITAFLIKTTSPGSVFFRQRRMGLNGRIFILYKFRTMFTGAEEKLAELEHLNEMDGPVFKIKNDPRIVPLGRFLRKISIDELPQLFNVFIGHMSLVGPRPPIPDEVGKYEHWQRRRLSMRPGITCLWQAGGRNKIGFKRWMELDLEYIDNWSLWLDFKILMKTIPVVLFGIGAR